MNKKIKSAVEIDKEIQSIFVESGSENEIVSRIEKFVNSITGKELVSSELILSALFHNIIDACLYDNRNLHKNETLIKLFPELLNFNKIVESKIEKLESILKYIKKTPKDEKKNDEQIDNGVFRILMNIMYSCEGFEKYLNPDKTDNFSTAIDENKSFRKLFDFLANNNDVAFLLNKYSYESKRLFIVELINLKIIPLNSIFIFFDINKNVSENTEYLYKLLKKNVPRTTIQTAIHDNLSKIKEGKFFYCPNNM